MVLNEKHKQFADEYLINGFCGRKAYLSVYKSVKSEATADVNASKLLSNAKVKDYISQKQAVTSKKFDITREYITNEYLQLIESAKVEGLDGQGSLKDRTNWAKALAQLSKLLGLDAPEKQEIEHRGIVVNYVNPKQKND
jgi:phage terminase small subunit